MRVMVLLLILGISFSGFSQKISFSQINKSNGLPGNEIIDICQDELGMVWISTDDGTVRFDGMSFHEFVSDIDDSASINEIVNSIHLDQDGELWLATPTGVQMFDKLKEEFVSYLVKDYRHGTYFSFIRSIANYSEDSLLLFSQTEGPIIFSKQTKETEYLNRTFLRNTFDEDDKFLCCATDLKGNVLVSAASKQLVFFEKSSFKVKQCPLPEGAPIAMTVDSYGRFWFPYSERLGIYTPETNTVRYFDYSIQEELSFLNEILQLKFMRGKLYLGTLGEGLFILDTLKHVAIGCQNNPASKFGIPDNGITALFEDESENVWVGTRGGGVGLQKKVNKNFQSEAILDECNFSRCNFVNSIIVGKDGTIWTAMDGGGLNYRRQAEFKYTSLLNFPGYDLYGTTALADGIGEYIWLGTFRYGLFKLDYDGQVLNQYSTTHSTIAGEYLNSNFIKAVFAASNGLVWIATVGGGVHILNENSGQLKTLQFDSNNMDTTISCSDATHFFEDSQHRMWVSTYWGLDLFSDSGNYLGKWVNDDARISNITSNRVFGVTQDTAGHFWVATGYGINHFDYGDSLFRSLTEEDGLADNSVTAIQIDRYGDVWASTANGLSKYDIQENRFYNFYSFNGLVSSTFRECSAEWDGKLYWGTEKGLVWFDPEHIQIDRTPPKVLITEFKLFNEKIRPGTASVLDQNLFYTEEIKLEHNQNFIGFEFSALSFADFQKAKFKYRLLGLHKDWVETSAGKRFADYSNLAPGDYELQVLGTNNDGIWSETPATLEIKLVPPIYKTALFRFIVIMLILISLVFFMRQRERKLSVIKQRLEKAVEERTVIITSQNKEISDQYAKLKVLSDTKDKIFSIIAHDLKNPLNALMGFSGLLSERYNDLPDSKKKKFISVINDSSRGMYGLLINLLDWARSQTGNLQFDPSVHNLLPIVEESILLISPQLEQKNVQIEAKVLSNFRVFADVNMLKTILRNLLNNAIKFSFRDDTVEIGIAESSKEKVTVYIKDSGVGMSPDVKTKLFTEQTPETTLGTEKEQGSGLGLIICKEFVRRNNGQIWAESEPGNGTTIYFSLPISDK